MELNLRQFATPTGAATRNNSAASGRGHAGAKAQFARTGALFRLICAFHLIIPSGVELLAGKAATV